MRSILVEECDLLLKRIESGKSNPESIGLMIERLDGFVEAWIASADLSKRAAERFTSEAKEYAMVRDILKEKLK